MRRLITFVFMSGVLFLAILFGTRILGSAYREANATGSYGTAVASDHEQQTSEQNGVEVTVERIERAGEKTTVSLALSNHQYDLASMDIRDLSSFGGQPPEDYIVQSSAMGGHHVSATLVFAGSPEGELIIGLRDNLTFEFPNL